MAPIQALPGADATKHGMSRLSHDDGASNRTAVGAGRRANPGQRGEEVLEEVVVEHAGIAHASIAHADLAHAYIPIRHITASLPALMAKRSASAGVAQP